MRLSLFFHTAFFAANYISDSFLCMNQLPEEFFFEFFLIQSTLMLEIQTLNAGISEVCKPNGN